MNAIFKLSLQLAVGEDLIVVLAVCHSFVPPLKFSASNYKQCVRPLLLDRHWSLCSSASIRATPKSVPYEWGK